MRFIVRTFYLDSQDVAKESAFELVEYAIITANGCAAMGFTSETFVRYA